MLGSADPLICKVHKLIRATTLRQQSDLHAEFAVCGFGWSRSLVVTAIRSSQLMRSLRSDLRGICDAFRTILVHVCVSCDISGLLSVCTWPAADSESDWWGCNATYENAWLSIFLSFLSLPQLNSYRHYVVIWEYLIHSSVKKCTSNRSLLSIFNLT